jgi:hypothetical protein
VHTKKTINSISAKEARYSRSVGFYPVKLTVAKCQVSPTSVNHGPNLLCVIKLFFLFRYPSAIILSHSFSVTFSLAFSLMRIEHTMW